MPSLLISGSHRGCLGRFGFDLGLGGWFVYLAGFFVFVVGFAEVASSETAAASFDFMFAEYDPDRHGGDDEEKNAEGD